MYKIPTWGFWTCEPFCSHLWVFSAAPLCSAPLCPFRFPFVPLCYRFPFVPLCYPFAVTVSSLIPLQNQIRTEHMRSIEVLQAVCRIRVSEVRAVPDYYVGIVGRFRGEVWSQIGPGVTTLGT